MMKKFVKTGLAALVLLFMVSTAQAQKFGYVNTALLVKDLPEMKQVQSDLQGFQAQLQKQGESRVTTFQQKVQEADQKKARGEMTPKEEQEVTDALQKEQQEIYQLGQELETKLAEKQQQLMEPILKKVNDAIKAVATEDSYQFIFDAQSGVILYADETTDVTEKVKGKLNM